MATILKSLPLIGLAFFTAHDLLAKTDPFAKPVMAACKNPAQAGADGYRTHYTGIPSVDAFMCLIVPFFQHALSYPPGFVLTVVFLAFAASFFAVVSVEAARAGLKRTLLGFSFIFGLVGQVVGISIVAPGAYLPLYEIFGTKRIVSPSSRIVSPARALSVPFSMFIGFGIPTAFMLVRPGTTFQENAIAIWQFMPIYTAAVEFIASHFLGLFVAKTPTSPSTSQKFIQFGHFAMAGLNAIVYASAIAYAVDKGVKLGDIFEFVKLDKLIAGATTPLQIGQYVAGYFLLIDFAVLFITCMYWVVIEHGIVPVLLVLLASPVVSPGAAYSLYSAWREGRFDVSEDDEVKKDI